MKKRTTLDTKYLDLLILILRGKNTATKLSQTLKLPRKTVSNRLIWLNRKGYIDKQIIFNTRPYELTEKGYQALKVYTAKSLGTPKGRPRTQPTKLRAHKVTWFMEIEQKPYDLKDLLRKYAFTPHKNRRWTQFKKEYEDFKIVFNPNKVYVYIHEFYVDDPMEYYPEAIKKLEKIKIDLEQRFKGLVLGQPNKVMVCTSNHIAKEWGPLATFFFERSLKDGKKYVYHGDRLQVDWSKGVPEEETVNPATAPADMLQLGDFWNQWLENPIQIKDLHQTKQVTQETSAGMQEIKEQILEQSRAIIEQTRALSEQNTRFSEQTKAIETQGDAILQQGEMIGRMAENSDTFATAMHEHLVLVKALQEVAIANKQGLEAMGQQLGDALGQIVELQRPWYSKTWDRLRKWWNKNGSYER